MVITLENMSMEDQRHKIRTYLFSYPNNNIILHDFKIKGAMGAFSSNFVTDLCRD